MRCEPRDDGARIAISLSKNGRAHPKLPGTI